MRAIVANMVHGVKQGFEKQPRRSWAWATAPQAQGNKVNLTLGFSHPVVHALPEGVKAETPTQTEIVIKGVDRQKVGQVAAEIRAYKSPEPYKGKGVRYADENVVAQRNQEEMTYEIAGTGAIVGADNKLPLNSAGRGSRTWTRKHRDSAAPRRRACASRARRRCASPCIAPTSTSTPR